MYNNVLNIGKKISELDIIADVTDEDTLLIVDESLTLDRNRRVEVSRLIPDAADSIKGRVRLANDLGGTADFPTVPALTSKANIDSPVFTGLPRVPTPSGTNSTQITNVGYVQNLLSSSSSLISASNYGAKGDLTYTIPSFNRVAYVSGTDDTSAIQAALNAAGAAVSSDVAKDTEGNVICFIDKGNYRITGTLTVPPNVVLHSEGWLFNFITDPWAPVIKGSAHAHARKIQVHANNKSGVTWGTFGNGDAHACNLESIVVWHAGTEYEGTKPAHQQKCGLRLHGLDYRLGHVWVRGGNVGLDISGASDILASNIFLVGCAIGLSLNSAEQIALSNVCWDSNITQAVSVNNSNNVWIRGQAFVNSDNYGTPMQLGVGVGKFTGSTPCSNINIEYTAQSTGGNGLEIEKCADSTFKINLTNRRTSTQTSGGNTAISHWTPTTDGALKAHDIGTQYFFNGGNFTEAPGAAIVYGSNLNGYIAVDLNKDALIPTTDEGVIYGTLNVNVSNTTRINNLELNLPLPVSSGGTGSTIQNFVDLNTTQIVGGSKSFTSGIAIGKNTSPTGYVDIKSTNALPTDPPQVRMENTNSTVTLVSFDGGTNNVDSFLDINNTPTNASGSAYLRLFRNTTTTGVANFTIHKGDGTSATNIQLSGTTNSYLNLLAGNVGIGTSTPGAKLQITGGAVVTNTIVAQTNPGSGNLHVTGKITVAGTISPTENSTTVPTTAWIKGQEYLTAASITTPATTDNSTKIATTAYVKNQNYQTSLGFTPVQQGGGIGQGNTASKIYIGWTGSNLKATVDSLDLGNFVTADYNAGSITLSNSTSNLLNFSTAGLGLPTFTSRSLGTKINLHPQLATGSTDYAIGIANLTLWQSIPQANNTYKFSWYAGQTEVMTLQGDGSLTLPNAGYSTTAPIADNSTRLATTAYVKNQNYQANLGFTPVQQGGGANQLNNKLYIGWGTGANNVRVQVDNTDLGPLAFLERSNTFNSSSTNIFTNPPTITNQPARGDIDQKVTTTNWVKDVLINDGSYGFGIRSLTGVGYQKIIGGLYIMWGTSVVTTDASGGGTVNFPVSLGSIHSVTCCNGDANAVRNMTANVFSWASNHFVFFTHDINGVGYTNAAFRVNWVAFGS